MKEIRKLLLMFLVIITTIHSLPLIVEHSPTNGTIVAWVLVIFAALTIFEVVEDLGILDTKDKSKGVRK